MEPKEHDIMPLEMAEAIANHKIAAGSIEDWQAAAYTLWAELDQIRGKNEYLEIALEPLARAWEFVLTRHGESVAERVVSLDDLYFWKPQSPDQIPGLSWADAKYAHDALNQLGSK